MKRICAISIAVLMFTGCAAADKPVLMQNSPRPCTAVISEKPQPDESPTADYTPLNFDEQKAVWVTYMDMNRLLADTEAEYTANVTVAAEEISELGLNTVYLHVRAFGDAYYLSDEFRLNENIPTEGGEALYDPLEIFLKAAHERNLSVHAWINPMRLGREETMQAYASHSDSTLADWFGTEYMSKPDDSEFYWLDPGQPEVRDFISRTAADLAESYDIDGLHIDDYFYPTTDASFDAASYERSGTELPLAEWRLENCSQMVQGLYDAVKQTDGRLLFGISPQGNIDNNYRFLYADVERWCSEDGFADYIAPQLYFGYENTVCPFAETLGRWEEMASGSSTKLVAGLAVYKLDQEDEFILNEGLIADQIADTESDGSCGGFALYSFDSVFCRSEERFVTEREAISAQLSAEE